MDPLNPKELMELVEYIYEENCRSAGAMTYESLMWFFADELGGHPPSMLPSLMPHLSKLYKLKDSTNPIDFQMLIRGYAEAEAPTFDRDLLLSYRAGKEEED